MESFIYCCLSPSHVWFFTIQCTAACQASQSLTIYWSLPEFMTNESVMPSNDPLSPSSPSALIFPASGSFPVSQLFASGGQSIGASASASVLPKTIYSWFSLGLTGLISLLSKVLSRVFSSITVWKHQFFSILPFLSSSSHVLTWLLERPQPGLYGSFLAKWSLCFLIHCLGLP